MLETARMPIEQGSTPLTSASQPDIAEAMTETPSDPRNLRQQIANEIAVSIRDGFYPQGRRLPSERDLAEQ